MKLYKLYEQVLGESLISENSLYGKKIIDGVTNNMKRYIKKLLRETNNKKYPTIPNLVYHGQPPKYKGGERQAPVKFDKFSLDDKRFLKDDNHGFYFTPQKSLAIAYADGGNVYTCSLNINNPYYYEHSSTYIYSYNNKGFISNPSFINTSEYNKLIDAGYDGVIALGPMNDIWEIVALHPEQIKIIYVETVNELYK
jgi:hypothetical protein